MPPLHHLPSHQVGIACKDDGQAEFRTGAAKPVPDVVADRVELGTADFDSVAVIRRAAQRRDNDIGIEDYSKRVS
jgi:hypothetical protein